MTWSRPARLKRAVPDCRVASSTAAAVLIDGFLVSTESRQHHSEVGPDFYTVGISRDAGPVLARRTLQIAGLM